LIARWLFDNSSSAEYDQSPFAGFASSRLKMLRRFIVLLHSGFCVDSGEFPFVALLCFTLW